MGATKHTTGPWQHEPVPGPAFGGSTFQVIAGTADGIDVRTVAFTGGDDDEANARLIAAAPELLTALQEMHRHAAGFIASGKASDYFVTWEAMARDAIAKATGAA